MENNKTYRTTVLRPQLGKRGLYPQMGTRDAAKEVDRIMNMLAFCDGNTSMLEIAEIINVPLYGAFARDSALTVINCGDCEH